MKTFYLIDGHSQIYRHYYAPMLDLTAPTGEPTKATYSFTKALFKLINEKKPDKLAIALDGRRSELTRRQIFPGYKQGRGEPDAGLITQVQRIKQIIDLLGIPTLRSIHDEADDIIASMVKEIGDRYKVVIVSRDKDLMQLLCDNVVMYDPMSEEWITHQKAEKKWECPCFRIVDVQTLIGDSTDSIPGAAGIGPKTAIKLLNLFPAPGELFGSVESLYKNVDRVPSKKQRDSLKAHDWKLTKQLVALNCDAEFTISNTSFTPNLNMKAVQPIFEELGFKRWVDFS